MNILFLDHSCHLKTKSADFFLEILRRMHTVETHYYERYYDCRVPKAKIAASDLVIFWEFLPGRYDIAISGKPCLLVPMYDNEWGSKWQWRRIAESGMSVLSFCDAITAHAKKYGVRTLLTVHYAFDPNAFAASGNPRRAIYWDRGNFDETKIRSLFASGALDELYIQRDFLAPADYERLLSRFGVYIAPRRKEGIGMAFLEQLARGKCIIAHDDATMNEYIENGRSGILRDFDAENPSPITAEEIAAASEGVRTAAEAHYRRWLAERDTILPFLSEAAKTPVRRYHGVTDACRFLFGIAEFFRR